MFITETPRLLLRAFERSDTPALARILGDSRVMVFSSKGAMTEAGTAQFIDWCIDSYREHGHGQWALIEKQSGTLIGFCGLSHATVNEVDEVEIAYRLTHDQWGKGLASEIAGKVLEHGFSNCNLDSIVGIVSPHHTASIRVLEKVGFESFSEARYGEWDVHVYRMRKP
ncbi:MAG: GNAT family N-acetyltransferase [Rhodocyclaceae bacterium]